MLSGIDRSQWAASLRLVATAMMAGGCLALAGCGDEEEGGGMRIDWDLSKDHTVDEVNWPEQDLDITTTSIEPLDSVRIRLPGGQDLRMADPVKRVIVYRPLASANPVVRPKGKVVDTVEVYSAPQTVDDAYRRALEYTEQFGLSNAALDDWRKRRKAGADPVGDRPFAGRNKRLGGKDGPSVGVELNYSSNDDRPWTMLVRLSWPEAG